MLEALSHLVGGMSRKPDRPEPSSIDLEEALSEKTFNAERLISGLRLLVVGANTAIYLAFTDKSLSIPWLAYAVIALSWIYSLYEYFFEPYRRHPVFLSAYFSAVTDAAFIILWLYATGGFQSSFYVLLYPAMVSVAFRFTARETVFAALVYSGAYFGLLVALDQVAGHEEAILVRTTYVLLTAILGHLISREVLEQTKRKITYKEHVKAVEEAEVKFRALAETANDAIISADSFGAIIYSNPSARRVFGYTAEELAAASLSDLIGPSGVVGKTVEISARRKDGGEFPAELSLAGWRWSEAPYRTAVVRDITERKRSEQTALELMREQTLRAIAEEAEHRAAFLAEASRILGSSLDHEAGLRQLARLVVPTFADHCAIDLIESDGSLKRVTDCRIDPSSKVLVEEGPHSRPIGEELAALLESGRAVLRPTPPATRSPAGGLAVAGAASVLTVPMIAQRAHGVMIFAMAGSGREFHPTEIAFAEGLGGRAAVAVEHSRLFRDAQEAIRARDDFLSVASHELNTPLTALQLQMDLLQQQTRNEGKLLNRVELARRQVMRLTKLIRNLLDVSRISSGKLVLEFENVDLCEVVCDAVERTEETRRRAGSPLQVSAVGPVVGRWDRMRVEQVVLNLLTNAIKYGEGKPIEVSVENAGEFARLKVRDWGMGIPPEEQSLIFERFTRAHSAQRYGGFGLGLWIVHQVVAALGGNVEVESHPGEGSTFTVELPISEPQAREPPAAQMR